MAEGSFRPLGGARDLRWLIVRSQSREKLRSLGRVVAGGRPSPEFAIRKKRTHGRFPADNGMTDDDVPEVMAGTPLRQANVGFTSK